MLDTRVLSLGVLTDEDSVDIVVGGLVSFDRDTRADVGEEGEGASEGQVERDVAFANWRRVSRAAHIISGSEENPKRTGSCERAFEGNGVLLDALDSSIRNDSLAVLQDGRDVDLLPRYGRLSSLEDLLDRVGDFRTDTCPSAPLHLYSFIYTPSPGMRVTR